MRLNRVVRARMQEALPAFPALEAAPISGMHPRMRAELRSRASFAAANLDKSQLLFSAQADFSRAIAEYREEGSDAAEVRATAARLDLAYVVQMSDAESMTTRFNELDQIDYAPAGPNSRIDESTPGFELVAEQDGMRLYRLLPAV